MTKTEANRMKEALKPFAELWKGISRGAKSGELEKVELTDEMFNFSDGRDEYSLKVFELRNAYRALNGKELVDPFETKRKGKMNPELEAKVRARRKRAERRSKREAEQEPQVQVESERDRLAREALGWS